MQSGSRILFSLCGGLLLTLALFWAMQWMITRQRAEIRPQGNTPAMEFVRLVRDSALVLKQRHTPEPPPEQATRPVIPDIRLNNPAQAISMPDIAIPAPSLSLNLAGPVLGPVAAGIPDQDVAVLSRTPPLYPSGARRNKTEGWVKLSLLITEKGNVQDVVVLDSSPAGVFDQAAIRAVYKWKFRPRIEHGEPVAARAEQTLEFQLNR